MKYGGASNGISGYTGWYTSTAATQDTGEEAYLPFDSDGYATSLTAAPTPPGGQKFNELKTLLNFNLPGTGGAAGIYPVGARPLSLGSLST